MNIFGVQSHLYKKRLVATPLIYFSLPSRVGNCYDITIRPKTFDSLYQELRLLELTSVSSYALLVIAVSRWSDQTKKSSTGDGSNNGQSLQPKWNGGQWQSTCHFQAKLRCKYYNVIINNRYNNNMDKIINIKRNVLI